MGCTDIKNSTPPTELCCTIERYIVKNVKHEWFETH